MYPIRECSEKAKRMRVYPDYINKREFSASVGKTYGFGKMKVGQSMFFPFREGCSKAVIKKLRATVSFINNNYKAYFVVIIHADAAEVSRLF